VIPVNKVGVMGAGLAKQFAQKFPQYVTAYKDWCKTPTTQLLVIDRFIFLPTKNHWRENSDLKTVLGNVRVMYTSFIPHDQGKSVSIPLVGAGLGGLDDRIVEHFLVRYAQGAKLLYGIETDVYGRGTNARLYSKAPHY